MSSPDAEAAPNYRSALNDALGVPIPLEGELRVWLDDDLEDRRAPDGWVHLRTAREACLLLLNGRVIELSLDNDLNGDEEFGQGHQVVDFMEEVQGAYGRSLWPRDGLTIHSANAASKRSITAALDSLPRQFGIEVESSLTPGGKPVFRFKVPDEIPRWERDHG